MIPSESVSVGADGVGGFGLFGVGGVYVLLPPFAPYSKAPMSYAPTGRGLVRKSYLILKFEPNLFLNLVSNSFIRVSDPALIAGDVDWRRKSFEATFTNFGSISIQLAQVLISVMN